uniref:Uncharacterized protein n=1 Tax=Rhizophora mucronata TaxID=61149 RepID=A0A2P2JFI5_RHIMU
MESRKWESNTNHEMGTINRPRERDTRHVLNRQLWLQELKKVRKSKAT